MLTISLIVHGNGQIYQVLNYFKVIFFIPRIIKKITISKESVSPSLVQEAPVSRSLPQSIKKSQSYIPGSVILRGLLQHLDSNLLQRAVKTSIVSGSCTTDFENAKLRIYITFRHSRAEGRVCP